MGKHIFEVLESVENLQQKNFKAHHYIQDILEHSLSENSEIPNKIVIEVSLFEEIATMITGLTKNDHKIERLLGGIRQFFRSVKRMLEPLRGIKKDLQGLKNEVKRETEQIQKCVKQVICVNKEFKERCQGAFIDYLKGIDIDLRKILKPLVPTSVMREQIHYPLINSMSSLASSNHSVAEQIEVEETQVESHPEPREDAVEKLNAHIQMLVGTLENLAKELIQVLTEANREYYLALGMQDQFSRPPTPLAAPLPDIFCYELEQNPQETVQKTLISPETRTLWVKRLKRLKKNQNIQEGLYSSLIKKLTKTDAKKIDLKELFINESVSISQRENIVYYLINGKTEFDKDVSLSDIMSEKKFKPEQQKIIKSKGKFFHKEGDRRLSPDIEVSKISSNFGNQPRVAHSIRLISKSPKIEKFLKGRKSIRVRSTTPINNKEKSGKMRTPSTQKSLNQFYAKHRIRKIL